MSFVWGVIFHLNKDGDKLTYVLITIIIIEE
jgi:hypothetical protein